MEPVAAAYDRIASAYADHYADELSGKPFDRLMLDWLVARSAPGPLCDLGCGPGQVAAHLASLGAAVRGIDCSRAQLREARKRCPGVAFALGDLLDLRDVPDATFGGVAAFYAIVHLAAADLPVAFGEMRRILRPGGCVLVTFHVGREVRHFEGLLGQRVDLDFHFFEVDEVTAALRAAGLDVTEALQRAPYTGPEAPTQRAYVWSRRRDD